MVRSRLLLSVPLIMTPFVPAYAQDKPRDAETAVSKTAVPAKDTTKKDDAAKKPEATPVRPETPPAAGTSATVLDLNAVAGVIGMSVKSYKGEDMGRIVDLLVTPKGDVRAAVIDFGGVLGVGSRKVAVDWKALGFSGNPKGEPAILALTRDQVRVSPEYKPGDPVVILEVTKPAEAKAMPAKAGEPIAKAKVEAPPPVVTKTPGPAPSAK